MADVPVPREKYLVSPNADVEKLWCKSAIAEKEARVKRLEADKEEIIKSNVLKIEATILMLKREIVELCNTLNKMDNTNDVIDV